MLSVGSLLKKEREKKGYTLKDIEREIKVREKYLLEIENNSWTSFSSKIYIIGIIKNYARFLGLDVHKMIAFFRRDYERLEVVKFKERLSEHSFSSSTKRLVIIGVVFLFLIFISYFGFQLYLYLSPPKVILISPQNHRLRAVEQVDVVGKTEKEATVTVFGDRVFLNKDGYFTYTLPLKKGSNTIKVDVTGANGKKTEFTDHFILE